MDAKGIKDLIAQNKLKEAIDALRNAFDDQDEDLQNQLLLLSSNYNHLVSEILQGLRERDQQMNRIIHSLIQLVDQANEKGMLAKASPAPSRAKPTPGSLQAIFALENEDQHAVLYHLVHSTYTWRNLGTLVKRTGLSEESIEAIARSRPDLIIRSRSTKGNIIFKLTKEARRKVDP